MWLEDARLFLSSVVRLEGKLQQYAAFKSEDQLQI
jgi:hypothetical protein